MNDKKLLLIGSFILLIVGAVVIRLLLSPVSVESRTDIISTSSDPEQIMEYQVKLPEKKFGRSVFGIQAKAAYKISGLVVSRRMYPGGGMNWLAPYDFALVWGDVPNLMPYLKFEQIVRFCIFHYNLPSPVDPKYVGSHMSNNHIIPANTNIRRALHLVKKGQKIQMQGYLVNVTASMPRRITTHWNTSLRRDDDGDGACEILYLQRLRIEDKVYE